VPLSKDKYIVYHGIELAKDSSIVNCSIEILLKDPSKSNLTPGRLWYNITDRVMRYSSLDLENNIIIIPIQNLNNFISLLQSENGTDLIGFVGSENDNFVLHPNNLTKTIDIIASEISNINQIINKKVNYFEAVSTGIVILNLDFQVTNPNNLRVLINGLEQYSDDYNLKDLYQIEIYLYNEDRVKIEYC